MLKRITILNSKGYGKAEIHLDCDSLQLVGPNNVGKSTLIYALNFLFIIDGRKMSFSGQRSGDKATINHYFPTPHDSFIVFENYKKGYYCILVKRDSEHELEYYRFDSDYREEFFFSGDGKNQKILKFDEVQNQFLSKGINFTKLKSKDEVFNIVYQRGKRNSSFVWLDENVKTRGLSNSFTEVYRFLINTKLITNKTLKDSLIIADNREGKGLSFSQKDRKDILDLQKLNNEIRNIRSIKNDFYEFKELINQYKAKATIISQLLYSFNSIYSSAISELDYRSYEKETERKKNIAKLTEGLMPEKDRLNKEIGGIEKDIQYKETSFQETKKNLEEILKIDPLEFLTEKLEKLNSQRKELEYNLQTVEKYNYTLKEVEDKINNNDKFVKTFNEQVKNYDQLLIQHISDDPKSKKLLNSLLSQNVLTLNKDSIKKKIEKLSDSILKIFDGEIDIKGKITMSDFESIQEIEAKITSIEQEQIQFKGALEVLKEEAEYKSKLANINKEINNVKRNLEKLSQEEEMSLKVKAISDEIGKLKKDKESYEKSVAIVKEDIGRLQNANEILSKAKEDFDDKIKDLKKWKNELDNEQERHQIILVEHQTTDSSEHLYSRIRNLLSDYIELKARKNTRFDKLKERIENDIADEDTFIRFVEEEIACQADKEKSIDGLLQNISAQFANPAHKLLEEYEHFKRFKNSFNQKLSQTKISNIQSLKIELLDNQNLINKIKQIRSIQNLTSNFALDFGQNDSLRVLNEFLDSAKKINFDELFDLELHLTIGGENKKVDLSKQMESDGTDRMIRLVIIMSIINRLALNDEDNKITLFIDEIATIDEKNRPELVSFCKQHNFIPIFAAPEPVTGFGKYYNIIPSPNGKIVVTDKCAVYASGN